jgi:ankyrin repeat protein
VVALLLRNGADPNAGAGGGVTPLHLSALHGDPAVIQALLAGGADRSAVDRHGKTPLQVAARSGHEEALLPSVAAE